MQYGFGVDLGGTTVKLAFFTETGEMLQKWEIPTVTDNGGERILPDIAAAVLGHLDKEKIPKSQVLGIGIGVPGPVDARGWVPACDNLGWGKTDVTGQLSALTGLTVKAGNDANMAALGECWKGSGSDHMLLVTLGTGVGGGIVVDGKPLQGVTGAAGEIGHMVLNPKETRVCGCGKRGCAEQYCSATGIVRLAKEAMGEIPLTAKDVFAAAEQGDARAKAVLEQVYDLLAQLIANVCIVVNPEKVVIGGGVSRAGQPLLEGIKRHFDGYIYHASRQVEFALATLGNDAGVWGAFKLLLD